MANEEQEVKEFNETIVIPPSTDPDDEIIEPVEQKDTAAPSSEEDKPKPELEEEPDTEEEEQEPEEEPEAEVTPEPKPDLDVAAVEKFFGDLAKDSKRLPNETAREWALRLDNSRVKGELRKVRHDELFVKKPGSPKTEEDFSEYDPEEVKRLETLVSKLGYVKKDDYIQQTVYEKNNAEFESFIEAHPEYSPENDRNGILWERFKEEFSLYNPPQDPKTLRKVLNKVHNEIYGVQPASNLNKINAQQQKLKTASHAGTVGSRASTPAPKAPNSNIRFDMLKGFDEDDLKELGA